MITNIGVTEEGIFNIDFSRAMMYPGNWIAKYASDSNLVANKIDDSIKDESRN